MKGEKEENGRMYGRGGERKVAARLNKGKKLQSCNLVPGQVMSSLQISPWIKDCCK